MRTVSVDSTDRLLPALLKSISVSFWREFECPKNIQKYMKFLKKNYIKNDSQLNEDTFHCYLLVNHSLLGVDLNSLKI